MILFATTLVTVVPYGMIGNNLLILMEVVSRKSSRMGVNGTTSEPECGYPVPLPVQTASTLTREGKGLQMRSTEPKPLVYGLPFTSDKS